MVVSCASMLRVNVAELEWSKPPGAMLGTVSKAQEQSGNQQGSQKSSVLF